MSWVGRGLWWLVWGLVRMRGDPFVTFEVAGVRGTGWWMSVSVSVLLLVLQIVRMHM